MKKITVVPLSFPSDTQTHVHQPISSVVKVTASLCIPSATESSIAWAMKTKSTARGYESRETFFLQNNALD